MLVVLAACGGDPTVEVVAPTFTSVRVDGLNPVQDGSFVQFYKEKNESVLVEITLENPSDFDIKQININGYLYRSTRFLEDSTNSLLSFYMDAGDALGLTAYSVDEIEYFDGSETRSVLVNTDNEFEVYVFKDKPDVVRDAYNLTQESISVDFTITDLDSVILDNSLIVKIFEGSNELTNLTRTLDTGFTQTSFSGLKSDTSYDVKIYADYDLDDTNGVKEEIVLFSGNFTTLPTSIPSALIENVQISSNSVTFDIVYNDDDNVTIAGGARVAVYDGDTFITSVGFNGSVEGVTFTDLLNSKEYNLRIITNYDLRNGEGTQNNYVLAEHTFETTAREVPVPQLDNIVVEENRILFDVMIDDDEDNPIIIADTLRAFVYVDDVLESIISISNASVEIQINDVLSGKDVRVEFVATYDLNDGNGQIEDQVIGVFERVSLLNEAPRINVYDVVVTQGYITLDVNLVDLSKSLLRSAEAILYEISEDGSGNEVITYIDTQIVSTSDDEIIFTHLIEASKNYRIVVYADYNLKDGEGNKLDQVLFTHELTSMQPKAPAAEIQDTVISNEGFTMDVLVMDADGTVVPNSVFLQVYKDGVLLEDLTQNLGIGITSLSFSGLKSDTAYEFVVLADFDVLDGSGLQEEVRLVEQSFTTSAKLLPTASIGDTEQTSDSIIFDVTINDTDDVVIAGSVVAVLYYNNVATGDTALLTVGDNYDVTFAGIQSDTSYSVRFFVDYDLNNEEGVISEYPLGEFTVKTGKKYAPVASIENVETDESSILFDVDVIDNYDVITGNIKALLYIGNTYTGQSIDLVEGLNIGKEFSGVYSDQKFVIYIVSDYDLNDGVNVYTEAQLAAETAETEKNVMVIGELYGITEGIDTITFSAVITDESNVVTNNLRAYLLLNGVETGDFVSLSVGDNVNKTFSGLISDSTYTIELRTDYSKRDQVGEITGYLLDSYTTITDSYTAPTATVSGISQSIDSIQFDTIISDQSNTSTGNYRAVLYYNGSPEGQTALLNEGYTQEIEFTNLYSDAEYIIRIEATYDLHDGDGDRTEFITDVTVKTQERLAPTGSANNLVITEDEVSFDFSYSDAGLTLIDDTFKVFLYDDQGTLIDFKDLNTDKVSFDISYLIADYSFSIKVTADFNLYNGLPVVDDGILLSLDLTTLANASPEASYNDVTINQTDVTADISISDVDETIIGDVVAYLKDADGVTVSQVTLSSLDQVIVFSGVTLTPNQWYQILLVADYDLRDGQLVQNQQVLGEYNLITFNDIIPQSHIFNRVITTSSITFDTYIYDEHSTYVGNAKAVLYKDGVEVDSAALIIGLNEDVSFSGLASNSDYVVEIVIDYDNNAGLGTISDYAMVRETITTVARVVPVIEFVEEDINTEDVTYDITVTDTDSVISGNLIAEIYLEGNPSGITFNLSSGLNNDVLFAGLLSDTVYELRVYADYDLQDGVNVLSGQLLDSISFRTGVNTSPSGEFSNLTSDKTSITFDVTVDDPNGVVENDEVLIRLYRDGVNTGITQTVSTGTTIGASFTNLYSDSTYRIDMVVDYDKNDGAGLVESYFINSASTVTYANVAPTAAIGSIDSDVDSIVFDVLVSDLDSVISGNLQAVLYYNNVPTGDTIALVVGNNTNKTFTGLFSDRAYSIKIEADYDMNDGSPSEVASVLTTDAISTDPKVLPSAELTDQTITNTEIVLDITVNDPTSTITGNLVAQLFNDGVQVGSDVALSVGLNSDVTFTGLDYGADYSIKVVADYNINEGGSDETGVELLSANVSTIPLVSVQNEILNVFDASFDITLDDQFGILDDEYLTLYLYDENEVLAATYVILSSGSVDVLNFYNDHTYRLDVEANVTGDGATVVYSTSLAMQERPIQTITLDAITATGTEITTSTSIALPDPSGVIDEATIEAVLYELQGGVYVQVDQTALIDGINNISFNVDGTDGTAYMIRIEATVNFNDGSGDIADYIITTRTFIWTTQN
jgi:hypothetical protein